MPNLYKLFADKLMTTRNILVLAVLAASLTSAVSAGTLDQVKKRGVLICGTNQGLAGFSSSDESGNWSGFDVDFCRAVAAAIFDDVSKVRFVALSLKDRFTALQAGDVDVLVRNTIWTLSRDAGQGLIFTSIIYFDGQGFMVPARKKKTSVRDLSGASVCVLQGSPAELNMADFFKANNLSYSPVGFMTSEDAAAAYESGRCDAYTTDASSLYADRAKFTNPEDHVILPETISKQPHGPVVRQADDQWLNIVKWTSFAMMDAEEAGITSKNVDEMAKSDVPEIRRILGLEGNFGEGLGLTDDWAYRIVKRVGNYGEVFDRNLGDGSKLHIGRGLNAVWTHGGLHYAPPIR
jgi:general L-amino acid transport system substrate-binding protein